MVGDTESVCQCWSSSKLINYWLLDIALWNKAKVFCLHILWCAEMWLNIVLSATYFLLILETSISYYLYLLMTFYALRSYALLLKSFQNMHFFRSSTLRANAWIWFAYCWFILHLSKNCFAIRTRHLLITLVIRSCCSLLSFWSVIMFIVFCLSNKLQDVEICMCLYLLKIYDNWLMANCFCVFCLTISFKVYITYCFCLVKSFKNKPWSLLFAYVSFV